MSDIFASDNERKPADKGDEESDGQKCSEVEVTDPAILLRGPPSPFLRYTRDELFAIRSLPLSKSRPSCLDDSFNNSRGCWDPDRWHSDKKHVDVPAEDERIREIPLDNHKRRSDPRERIRKEQDGIVLSPQRRSFNTGCYMPATSAPVIAVCSAPSDMPAGGGGGKAGDGRRIGSGRILNRDTWDFGRTDKQQNDMMGGIIDEAYSFRPGGGGAGPNLARDRDDSRYERRSFSREFDSRDKDASRGRDNRDNRDVDRIGGTRSINSRFSGSGDRRRVYSDCQREPEEPEWFSGGPTSQHDTIELRGFEDIPEEKTRGKKQQVQQKKAGKKGTVDKDKENRDKDVDNKKQGNEQSTKDKNRSLSEYMKMNLNEVPTNRNGSPQQRSTSTPVDIDKSLDEKVNSKSPIPAALQNDSSIINASVSDKGPESANPPEPGFVLEDFLNLDSIPGLLTNGNTNETAGSRFSQFFRRDSPPTLTSTDSRRSSLQDEINTMLSDSNKYFTPISPAANSVSSLGQAPSNNLLEMLQRAKNVGNDAPASNNDGAAGGKIHNVEELEARMRRGEGHNLSSIQDNKSNKNEEIMAFQKLLSQVTTAQTNPVPQGRPVSKSQPMSILEMLNKSQQADENAARASMGSTTAGIPHQMGTGAFGTPTPNAQQQPPQVPPELVMKLLQVQQIQRQQQQQLSQFMANAAAGHNFPKPPQAQNTAGSPLPNAAPDIQNIFGGTAAQQQYARELLQRPEAQAIIHGLKHNKISVQHLMQQLNNPAMQQRHREMLIAILKTQGHFGHSPRNISPVGPSQNADLMQHMMLGAQQQLRVSPLPNAYCVSPILATSPNTLSVHHTVIPPRMPSPMELQAHTRNILQGALIKKKLEEQSENFRKRQEMQRSHSPNPNNANSSGTAQQTSQNTVINNSPAKHVSSPTPLAFTPTSVLRKMTAEKEPEGIPKSVGEASANSNNKVLDKNISGNPSTINMRPSLLQNRTALNINWNANKQPQGRPIVKGGGGLSVMNQAQPQVQFASNIEFQQMQNQFANIQARSKMNFPQNHNMPPNYANMQFNNIVQQNNSGTSYGPNFNNAMNRAHAQQAQHLQRTNYHHQQIHPMLNSGILGFNQRDGALSPTSNQLARWFSPELLAQASAGKLPPVNLAQNALSLEELERIQQSSATVHN